MSNTITINLVTYDGTDETLPNEYEPVLVSGGDLSSAYRAGLIWVFHNNKVIGVRLIQKGDRWGYIPEIEEQTDDCR